MAKRIVKKPDWLDNSQVEDLFSVSSCCSEDFADYIEYWQHNGYWLFDSPEIILSLAEEHGIDLSQTTLFYYEAYEYQYHEDKLMWEAFEPEVSFETNIQPPREKLLEGYDVVSFFTRSAPECSYLSCNHMAEKLEVNAHCLISGFEEAKEYVEQNVFDGCEPGPCRIFAVYSLPNAWRRKSLQCHS
ncbi:MAG: hypothetical protein AAFY72_17765 [Cyanobacteria bacterium J06649_4]